MLKMILSASLILSLSSQAAEKKTSEQYWTETGLTSQALTSIVSTRNCYKNANNFHGCISALNSLLSGQEPVLMIVPSALAGDASLRLSAATKDFGKLAIVGIIKQSEADSKESFRANWLKSVAIRDKTNAAIKATFESTPLVDFGAIFASVQADVFKDKTKEAKSTADAITAYLVEAQDPHSHLDARAEAEAKMADSSDNFSGIGATLQSLNGKTVVQSPIEGSPAVKAGVRPNDVILNVDNFATDGVKLDEVVKRIRGPEGTTVVLKIQRAGKIVDVPIVRGKINIENLSAKVIEDSGVKVGYLKLRSFMDRNSCSQMEARIKSFEASGATALILDLRGDGGGLLDQANCIGGIFLGDQVIVKVKDLQSNTLEDQYSNREQVTKLPMVVMVDANSASASEIVSGALQDDQRAWVVGERSFGKATVQSPVPFMKNEKIMMFTTIQRFYQPSGRTNQIVGIQPNFEVPVKPDATEDERFQLREGDIYPNAFDALNPPYKETRPEEAAKIKSCVSANHDARDMYEKAKDDAIAPDYQLYYAEEVLRCAQ